VEAPGTEGLCCLCRVAAAAALACCSPVTLAALPTASMLGLFLSIAACCIPHFCLSVAAGILLVLVMYCFAAWEPFNGYAAKLRLQIQAVGFDSLLLKASEGTGP
jgi:hypothetical protein